MTHIPAPDPLRSAAEALLIIKEKERKRNMMLSLGETSQKKRPSRKVLVLGQLAVLLLFIAGIVLWYHALH